MARMMIIVTVLVICQIIVIIEGTNKTENLVIPVGNDAKQKAIAVSTRIIGGSPTTIKTYPFAVSVQWRIGSRHHCGGTYIMPYFVLSAAHCMVRNVRKYWQPENPRFYVVIAGTTNLWYTPSWQIITVSAVLPHAGFDFTTMAHDIGLFKLSRPLQLTAYVSYAPLPLTEDDSIFRRKDQICTVIGWGKTSEMSTVTSDTLQHVQVPLISTEDCGKYFTSYLHRSQICAGKREGGVDACQGDSGGPLLCNNVQIGIVSWGYGCAAPYSPGVYVRVDHYLDWIGRTLLKNSGGSTIRVDCFIISLFFTCIMAFHIY